LALEAREVGVDAAGGNDLDGHVAIEPRVASVVHDPHGTAPQLAENLVFAEGAFDHADMSCSAAVSTGKGRRHHSEPFVARLKPSRGR
jgi:hypothetical protein